MDPMPGKLLQWLGVASVLALVGGAAFALSVVKDRIQIVVQAGDAPAGADPVALLRDDVQVAVQDVAELRAVLAASLERLANALEERAEVRHADVRSLLAEVVAMRQRLEAIEARLQSGPAPAVAAPAAAPEIPAPVPQPIEPAVAQAPPKSGAFLSFSVPAQVLRFDEAQQYQIVPELSRVGFDAKSTLHDFSGVTSKLSGQFTADFDDPEGRWSGEVVCDAATLVTGVDGRDENMREHLDTKNNPQIRFVLQRFVPAPGGVDVGKRTARGEVVGQMTIRGVARELRMKVTIEVDASRRVVLNGEAPLLLSDYGVPVPSQLGVINMQDEVKVWIALRARVKTGELR
jgi:polyisoprenoid-binding protein YceI